MNQEILSSPENHVNVPDTLEQPLNIEEEIKLETDYIRKTLEELGYVVTAENIYIFPAGKPRATQAELILPDAQDPNIAHTFQVRFQVFTPGNRIIRVRVDSQDIEGFQSWEKLTTLSEKLWEIHAEYTHARMHKEGENGNE